MHIECFQIDTSDKFSCKTDDMITFNCKCISAYFKETTFIQLSDLSLTSEYFPGWLDKEGPFEKRELSPNFNRNNEARRFDDKLFNLKELFDHCHQNDYSFLECFTSKNRKDVASCFCKDEAERYALSHHYFSSNDVWSGPKSNTSSSSFSVTSNKSFNISLFTSIFIVILFIVVTLLIKKNFKCLKDNFTKLIRSCKKSRPDDDNELA